MMILFDQGVPAPLRYHLVGHKVATAFEKGWSGLKNGVLLQQAEQKGFEIFVTTDQNLRYQQNLQARKIAIVVLQSTSWPKIKNSLDKVVSAIILAKESTYLEVEIKS